MITSGATILIANFADLSSLSTMGSAGFLIIFAAVNGANVLLAENTKSKRLISLIGAGLCLGALGSLIWRIVGSSPGKLWVLFIMVGAAFFIEVIFRVITGRPMTLLKNENKDTVKS